MLRYSPYHDASKSLYHCELIMDNIKGNEISVWDYEFFYNSFIYHINKSWELATNAKEEDNRIENEVEGMRGYNNKKDTDPLLIYVVQARNQLTHREEILWISDEEDRPENIGEIIVFGDIIHKMDHKRYSASVLPTFSLNATTTEVAIKDVKKRGGERVPVPETHLGTEINNTPNDIINKSYEFYGSKIAELVDHDSS